jgi:hypothetical protein
VLETLKQDIENCKETLKRIQKEQAGYFIQAEKLKLPLPTSLQIFHNNRQQLPRLKSAEEILQGQLNDGLLDCRN